MENGWRASFGRSALAMVIGLAMVFVGAGGVSASAGTSISAGSASMSVGTTGTSTAVVTRAAIDAHFNAFDVTLAFDPAIVSVSNVEPAAGWSLMPAPRIDNGVGTVQVIAVRFDECAISCPIFQVEWEAIGAGSSPLSLAGNVNESLAGAGEYISATFTAGMVVVAGDSEPDPEPTTTPTQSPSPSPTATSSPTASPTAAPATPVPPAPGGTAVIVGGSGGAPVGDTVTTGVSANIGASGPIDSYEIEVSFDPAIAEVASISAGPGWSFAPQPVIDNDAGRIRVSALRFSECAPSCLLFQITWNAVAPGTMKPSIVGSDDELLGRNGAYIPASYVEGVVTVAGARPLQPGNAGPQGTADVPALPHSPGWNLLTWGGATLSPKDALAASDPETIEVIYVWDAKAERWRKYGPGLPSFVNDLQEINPGDVIWLNAR